MATITIELPETIIQGLEVGSGAIERQVLEAVALEGYRSQRLSRGQVAQILGLSWHATEKFLADHGTLYHYDFEDLDEDRRNLKRLLGTP